MKAKDRRRIERMTEQERKESGISYQDARRLVAEGTAGTPARVATTDKGFLQDLIMEQQEQG